MNVKGSVAIRYPRGTVRCEDAAPELPVYRSCLKRDGDDVLIVAVGTVVYDALDAAERLERKRNPCGSAGCPLYKTAGHRDSAAAQ